MEGGLGEHTPVSGGAGAPGASSPGVRGLGHELRWGRGAGFRGAPGESCLLARG